MFAIVLYMDETWLSRNGHAAVKPLVMTLGNVSRSVYNQDYGKKVVLHFRGLGGSRKTRNSNRYRQVNIDIGIYFF